MRTTEDREPGISHKSQDFHVAPGWFMLVIMLNWSSLKSERAAVEFSGGAEAGLFGGRTAEEQELMGGVHELQLLEAQKRRSETEEIKV